MTVEDVENHAAKYSQAYRYDKNYHKKNSKWTTDFDAMALKTVIKLLLSKWGILSVEMQRALEDDQKIFDENLSVRETEKLVMQSIRTILRDLHRTLTNR